MTPQERITSYLFAHKSSIQTSTVDLVVSDVKWNVFYGMSPIPEDEIRKTVVSWATVHAIGLLIRPSLGGPVTTPAPPGPSSTASDIPMVDAVKKAIATISDGVTIGRKDKNINLGVGGATANLKSADGSVSVGISWTGTLKLDAESGPFHFSGNLSKDKWEMTLSFPQDTYIPDMSTLGKVFAEGEQAIGRMADATRSFKNLNDATKVASLMKPNATKVQSAVDALGGLVKANKKGGPSFGLKFESPDAPPGQDRMQPGVQGQVVFTYVF